MAKFALQIAGLSAVLHNMVRVQASSSAYHHIQVGGPANQITTGEIRIDLPSESFQNLKFNITPYSLQNQYSPYYYQYRAGYQQSAYSPPKTQTNKQSSQSAYKSLSKGSYKPAPVVSYKSSPSIHHQVYSYPQTTYNQPQVSYNLPIYTQPKVSYNKPTYSQPKVSYNAPSYKPIQAIQPSYQPQNPVYSYKPIKATALHTKPGKEASEGDYSSYPYPYQQTVYRQPATQKQITSVVGLKEAEDITEAAAVEEVTEGERSGKTLTESAGISNTSKDIYSEVFKQFISYNLELKAGSERETEEAREAKTLDTDAEDFDQNSVDSVASSTLLPEFIPIVFEEAGVPTKDNTLPTTEESEESTTLLTTSSATAIAKTTTARLTTTTTARVTTATKTRLTTTTTAKVTTTTTPRLTTTTIVPTTLISITTTASTPTTTAFSIRRRPVISLFHDLTTSASPAPIQSITPPGDIGQSILDKMRTDTLTVQKIADSEEDITINPTEDKNNAVKGDDKGTGGELETEINKNGDEEKSRERRKIVKVRKLKSNAVNQESNFSPYWQNGRLF